MVRPPGARRSDTSVIRRSGFVKWSKPRRPSSRAGLADRYSGEVVEAGVVGCDYRASGGPCGGGDDHVVGAARPTPRSGGDEELRVAPGHLEVVGQHRERRDQILDESP